MVSNIIMPKAGMAMEEGMVIRWLASEGDTVVAGEPLFEIETDKVSMEIEAPASGTLLKILAVPGTTVPVIQTIGYIGQPGDVLPTGTTESATASSAAAPSAATSSPVNPVLNQIAQSAPIDSRQSAPATRTGKIPATPLAKTLARQMGINLESILPTGPWGEVKARDVLSAEKRIKITPLAKQMATANGIDLKTVRTDRARITSDDIKAVLAQAAAKQTDRPSLMDGDSIKPVTAMRKTIATRMYASHIEIPPVTMDIKVDVTGLLAFRQAVNKQGGNKISINDFVVKACAEALAETPSANVSFAGDSLIYRKHINVGVAVSLDAGLIVPVLKDTDRMSLEEISLNVKLLAEKARKGKLTPGDYTGGTFTISNLGPYGITFFTPIINQPETMILGVCAIEKVLKLNGEQLSNRDIMGLSLTFDHRAHDGASAAAFLKKIVDKLELYNTSAKGEANA